MPRPLLRPTRRAALTAVAVFALGAASRGRADEAASIRIGYQKFNTLNILKGTGRLDEILEAKGISVAWTEFQAGPQLLEALHAGAIDFGHAADAPCVFAQAAGVDFLYLAAEPPYPAGIAVLVSSDSPLQRVADLKGRKVAIGRGWNVQHMLVRALEEAGLGYGDIEPVHVTNAADARAAFQSGRVAAVGLWDPFLAGAQLTGEPRVLRDGAGLSSNRTFYVGSRAYVAANAGLLRTVFVELKAMEAWAQGHPDEVAALLAPQLGVPVPVLRLATGRRTYGVVSIDAGIAAEQQRMAEVFRKLDLIPHEITVQDAVADVSLV
jgi:NitT/TauT family transport system substrate-binding protein/sulfonate transport system substrate-binding protein